MSPAAKKEFRPAHRFAMNGLPPSAEETAPDAETSGRQDVQTSTARPRTSEGRIAFTWRMTVERKRALDRMAIEISEQIGRPKLDRAEMFDALADLALENSGVRGALIARLQAD